MRITLVSVLIATFLAAHLSADENSSKNPGKAESEGASCHGTAVQFVPTPKEAAQLAAKQKKLVFVLHVSGYFEDPGFT